MTQLAAAFDKDPATLAAYQLARETFDKWATIGAADPQPEDAVDAIQLALMRWQRDRFGDQIDERMALGIIEEMVETFLADELNSTEAALDGLGDTCVYSAQLCTANRLALGPILDLARVFTRRQRQALVAHGMLAQVVLKGAQKIRGLHDRETYRIRLVGAIASCIAKAIDDVEEIHCISVKPREVLLVVAREVLARAEGHDAIPKAVPSEATRTLITPEESERRKRERRAEAEAKLAASVEGYDPATDEPVSPSCLECGAVLSAMPDADLWKCSANEEHVFTSKRVISSASGIKLTEHTPRAAPDAAFDDSDAKTDPGPR